MSRGSKPGERRGGRQRGTPNKKTVLRNAALAAAAANPELLPLEFLLGIMRDPNVSPELRIKVAQATLPFVHAKPASAHPGDPAGTAKLIDATGALTIDNAVAKALRDDYHRLGELDRPKRTAIVSISYTASAYRLHHVAVVLCPTPKIPRKRS